MADFQEQLQSILGDPQAMGQIAALARTLTGGGPSGEGASPPPPEGDFVPVDASPPGQAGAPNPPPNGGVPDLSALLGSLGIRDVDPRLIQTVLRLSTEYAARDDEKAALLAALKPFLRPERREKMEKAERAARLSRLVRLALELLKEEGRDHV